MSRLNHQAIDWMRAHNQAISNATIGEQGLSLSQKKRAVANRQIVRVVQGAYAAASATVDEVIRSTALCMAHPELVIAGPSAGRHWQLRFVGHDELVHTIGPPASHPCIEPWLKVFRTALLDPEDVVELADGRRVTSPPRTVVDLTRYVSASTLASIIEHVICLGYTSVEGLRRCAERLNTPGRPWVRRFLRVLAGRLPGAPSDSGGEDKVLQAFQRRGVRDLVRQYPTDLSGYGPVRFDLSIPEIRWVFEVDLHPSHWTPEGIARDQARDAAATAAGWITRRGGPVRLRRENFATTIADAVQEISRRRDDVARLAAAGLWPPR